MIYIHSREIPMSHFLSFNKNYKYEEFFIDEYAELNDIICYIEEKILILYWYLQLANTYFLDNYNIYNNYI
jgi:hypothetical protein